MLKKRADLCDISKTGKHTEQWINEEEDYLNDQVDY